MKMLLTEWILLMCVALGLWLRYRSPIWHQTCSRAGETERGKGRKREERERESSPSFSLSGHTRLCLRAVNLTGKEKTVGHQRQHLSTEFTEQRLLNRDVCKASISSLCHHVSLSLLIALTHCLSLCLSIHLFFLLPLSVSLSFRFSLCLLLEARASSAVEDKPKTIADGSSFNLCNPTRLFRNLSN